jgi:hypothetical protein
MPGVARKLDALAVASLLGLGVLQTLLVSFPARAGQLDGGPMPDISATGRPIARIETTVLLPAARHSGTLLVAPKFAIIPGNRPQAHILAGTMQWP